MSTPIIEPYAVFMLYGRKIFIFLEEVGMLHSVHPNSLTKGEQKNPELTRIGPYGRIPADTSSNTPPATQKVAGSYGYGEGDAKAARSCVANSLRALMAQRKSDCAASGTSSTFGSLREISTGPVSPICSTGCPKNNARCQTRSGRASTTAIRQSMQRWIHCC